MRHYRADSQYRTFRDSFKDLQCDILMQPLESVGQWQSQDTDVKTRELMGVVFELRLPPSPEALAEFTGANLPWAEDHFQERVSGRPLNPPPSEAWWPFNQNGNKAHKFQKDGQVEKFSHTYPERFWPKYAGDVRGADQVDEYGKRLNNLGIRYGLGDLADVVALLRRSPGTRQAFLPVWFPEDTGTVHGQRVPCSLGYHFLIRGGRLHMWYYMRSCDLMRHFQDDVYMAGRLNQWICDQLGHNVQPGRLNMMISSLHTFEQDDYALREVRKNRDKRR
jgi:hypothetical protein